MKFLIREGKYTADVVEAARLSVAQKYDDSDDPMMVVKEFDAVCWCAAKRVYAAHQGHEPYDMTFCKEDAKHWVGSMCQHYAELMKAEESG